VEDCVGFKWERLEWEEDLDTAENTLEILVTSNRSNELKLLLRGHMQGQSNAVARN
jgi:hypothetical protein